uniref:Uncharacterized protein n=1 Tax=Salmonella sp. TaxID=599 RepID=A0A482ETQ1_SALSP|nr:hypothetical protein NNIBIDOC_00076 [Salmonella sp.]
MPATRGTLTSTRCTGIGLYISIAVSQSINALFCIAISPLNRYTNSLHRDFYGDGAFTTSKTRNNDKNFTFGWFYFPCCVSAMRFSDASSNACLSRSALLSRIPATWHSLSIKGCSLLQLNTQLPTVSIISSRSPDRGF